MSGMVSSQSRTRLWLSLAAAMVKEVTTKTYKRVKMENYKKFREDLREDANESGMRCWQATQHTNLPMAALI